MPGLMADGQPYEAPLSGAVEGYADTPPSFADYLKAAASSNSPTLALARSQERQGLEGTPLPAGGLGEAPPIAGYSDSPMPPSPTLDAETANKWYPDPDGKTLFSGPVKEDVAQQIARARRDEVTREGILTRGAAAHSTPVNFATQTAGFLMDPLNAASLIVPGIGEEAILGAATRIGLEGVAARSVARAGATAAAVAVTQAPLTAMRYGIGQEETSDFTIRDAMTEVLGAAAMGAVAGAGFGFLGDVVRGVPMSGGRLPAAPEARAIAEPLAAAPVEPRPVPEPLIAPDPMTMGPIYRDPETGRVMFNGRDVTDEPILGFHPDAAPIALGTGDATGTALRTAISQLLVGRPVDVMPILDLPEMRLIGEEARLRSSDAELAQFLQAPVDVEAGRAAAVKLGLLEDVQRQLAEEGIEGGERRALEERRDEILTNATPEALQEAARQPELQRQARAQRAAIADRLAEIGRERTRNEINQVVGAAINERLRSIDLSGVATDQRQVWRNGFAPGVAPEEFARATEEIYGKPPEERAQAEGAAPVEPVAPPAEPKAKAKPGEPEGPDPEIVEAERQYAEATAGRRIGPEEQEELNRTSQAVQDASAREQAYLEAAACLAEGGA